MSTLFEGERSAYILVYCIDRVSSPSKLRPSRVSHQLQADNDYMDWDSTSHSDVQDVSVSEYADNDSEDVLSSESMEDEEEDNSLEETDPATVKAGMYHFLSSYELITRS